MDFNLTRRQEDIYHFLKHNLGQFQHPPSIAELCRAMGLSSRGSMHKQVQALVDAGLVEPMNNLRRGIRLTKVGSHGDDESDHLPLLGRIAAGRPIEAVVDNEHLAVPVWLRTHAPCYLLEVKGDSMIGEGIFDGDYVVIERRDYANNGEIVVALIDNNEATLKRIEQKPTTTLLHPANSNHEVQSYHPEQIQIQGVLVSQMRRYH